MKILSTNNLTKKYGSITAVDNLTIEIPKGSVFGILGPNGSGKTTTLSIILGIVNATSGSFKWFNNAENENFNKNVGAIIEQPNFYPYLNAIQNLDLVAEIREIKENRQQEIERVLKYVQLWERKTSSFSSYSYGMKRRLALAACLLGNPEVLILDEPTNGLDPEGIALVRNIIIEESKVGKTIILASHILDEVEKVCTHVIVLKKGSLIISGTVNDVLKGDTKYHIISENNTLLQDVLEKNDTIKTWNIEGETLIITLKENIDIKQVSLLAMENKILITSLESKKKTLEAEFLQLVK